MNQGSSNLLKQEELPEEKGTVEGLANYQSALGKWLGTELVSVAAPFSQEELGI